MKTILIKTFLLTAIAANAQSDTKQSETDSTEVRITQLSDSTSFGRPDGTLASKEIGTKGGSIISDDRRVELIFPEGALTENTTISIQPTTNPLPNGAGKAYWFEPSGTQFKKPVQFIFHYNDEEADNCPPELMAMALQDKKGNWTYLDYEDWDSTGKVLKGYIHHFTGATSVFQMRMAIGKTELRVNESTSIDFVSYLDEGNEALFATNQYLTWKVNNDVNGNEVVGTVRQLTFRVEKRSKMINAIYTAPNVLPFSDTIYIEAEVFVYNRKKKIPEGRTFKKKVIIYDMYKISLIHEIKGSEFGIKEFLGGGELIDSASCIIKVYHHEIRISDIQNYEPKITKAPGMDHGGTLELKIFTAGTQGSIHLTTDYRNFRLRHYPPEVFFLLPLRTITGFRVQYVGKKFTGPVQTVPYPSLPPEIEFIANGQQQQYNVYIGGIDSHKLIVTPHRGERQR